MRFFLLIRTFQCSLNLLSRVYMGCCWLHTAVVVAVYFNLDNINQISIYKNLWGCTIRVSRIWQEIACSHLYKYEIWMKQRKKRIQFNNIDVRGDGHLWLLLFVAFLFITIHWICMHISGSNLFIVSSCVRPDLLILYFSLALLCAIVRQ